MGDFRQAEREVLGKSGKREPSSHDATDYNKAVCSAVEEQRFSAASQAIEKGTKSRRACPERSRRGRQKKPIEPSSPVPKLRIPASRWNPEGAPF